MTEPQQTDPPSIGRLVVAARAVLDAAERSGPAGSIADLATALPALRRAVEAFDHMG